MAPMSVGKLRLVDAGRVVCCKGVCDQEAESCLHDEDLGIRTKKNVCIWAVRL